MLDGEEETVGHEAVPADAGALLPRVSAAAQTHPSGGRYRDGEDEGLLGSGGRRPRLSAQVRRASTPIWRPDAGDGSSAQRRSRHDRVGGGVA